MKINFKKLFSRWEFAVVLSLFIGLLALFYFTFFTPNYYALKEPVKFEIKSGEPFTSISRKLYDLGVIPSETNFRIAAFIYGAEKKVRAARYHIPNGLSYLDLLDMFISGKCDFSRSITIKDGQTIKWLGSKLENTVFVDSSKFVALANDKEFISSLGLNQNTMEGYLFPKEYQVYERSSPEEAIKEFYTAFKNYFVDSLKERTKDIGFTIHQVLTLASIIKGETDKVEEMPTIASVYLNRLRLGMKLQADPTIQFLLPDGWRRLLYKDLEIESAYNTYKYGGLPPGPINNPGANAIFAVLYPADTNYLYFVADGKGGHNFSKSLREHNNKVNEYRRSIRSKRTSK
jgi:peptidoglycan lytic transglycosylase G